ncbi:unnamed protein product, partial [Prorocentrum cordatum]
RQRAQAAAAAGRSVPRRACGGAGAGAAVGARTGGSRWHGPCRPAAFFGRAQLRGGRLRPCGRWRFRQTAVAGPEGAERRRRRLRPGHGVAAGAGAARAAPGKPPGAARRRRLQRCRGRLPAGRPLGGRALVPRARSRRPAPPRRRRLRGRAWRAAGVPWRLVAALLEEMRAAQVGRPPAGGMCRGAAIAACGVGHAWEAALWLLAASPPR